MNFRRQPFQFTSLDPAKRQAELQKRFGLPSNSSDMYVDCMNQGIMGAGIKNPPLAGGSPRLQHRVPIFKEGFNQPNSEQNNVDTGHKPRVRVVPIQVEGADSKRHRNFSGPAGSVQDTFENPLQAVPNTIHTLNKEDKTKPRVCNIPIHIDKREKEVPIMKEKGSTNVQKPESVKTNKVEINKSAVSQTVENSSKEPEMNIPLKQIENVLIKLKTYQEEVEKFEGTLKDKQYRYLDEMLTRCMLDLDNVDTLGLDGIRLSRKAAVKQVQACIDLLDTKINPPPSTQESLVLTEEKVNEDSEMVVAPQNIDTESDEKIMDVESVVQEKVNHFATDEIEKSEQVMETAAEDSSKCIDRETADTEINESIKTLIEDSLNVDGSKVNVESVQLSTDIEMTEVSSGQEKSEVVIKELIEEQKVVDNNKDKSCVDEDIALVPIVTEPSDECIKSEESNEALAVEIDEPQMTDVLGCCENIIAETEEQNMNIPSCVNCDLNALETCVNDSKLTATEIGNIETVSVTEPSVIFQES